MKKKNACQIVNKQDHKMAVCVTLSHQYHRVHNPTKFEAPTKGKKKKNLFVIYVDSYKNLG